MFSLNPFAALKNFREQSVKTILLALFILIPYIVFRVLKSLAKARAVKQSVEAAQTIRRENDSIAHKTEKSWKETVDDVEKQRGR